MEAVVKEFEREYAHGHQLDVVRQFVNKYYIQGGKANHGESGSSFQGHGDHIEARDRKMMEKDIEAKLDMLEKLLGTRKGSSTTID